MSTILSIILTLVAIAVVFALIKAGLDIVAQILATVLGFLTHYWLLPIVLAGLSYWIFERFWLGLIIGLIITLIFKSAASKGSDSNDSDYDSGYDGNDYYTREEIIEILEDIANEDNYPYTEDDND